MTHFSSASYKNHELDQALNYVIMRLKSCMVIEHCGKLLFSSAALHILPHSTPLNSISLCFLFLLLLCGTGYP